MDWGLWFAIGMVALETVGLFGFIFWRNYVRPFSNIRIVVFDTDDEHNFFVHKRKLMTVDKVKGVILFRREDKPAGEFYSIPLSQEKDQHLAKRDDIGHVTYYFFRNNPNPVMFSPDMEKVFVVNNASLTAAIVATKIFDNALLNEKKFTIKAWMVILAIIIVILIAFREKLGEWLGVDKGTPA
jgi:hypothetical protein